VFRAYATIVRLAYLSAAAVTLYLAVWSALSIARNPDPGYSLLYLSTFELFVYGLLIACALCAVRALSRPLRRDSFLPESHLRERPVVGTLVALTSAFASFLVFNLVLAFLQLWPDTHDANFGGPSVLALLLYAIALLTGEIVLVGRTARITS
jgi:MFS-type transporter involved in bile tolerance (Atg22 family)